MAEIKYIDKNGLQQAIGALKVKTDAAYLAKDGVAVAAEKLNTARKINGVDFDGTADITIKAEPEVHQHVMADITDLQAAMDKKVDKETGKSLVLDTEIAKIHEHDNKAELDKIVSGKTDAWDAKIGVADADKLSYNHNNMGGAKSVKAALDLLAEVDAQYVIEINALKTAVGVPANADQSQLASGLHKLIADGDAAAKAYADQQITALVNGAPEAMNTLNKLAVSINDNKDIYDAWVEQHELDMAALKLELQGEIDADVLVEANRAKGVEQGFETRIAALEGVQPDTHVALTQSEIEEAINNAWV